MVIDICLVDEKGMSVPSIHVVYIYITSTSTPTYLDEGPLDLPDVDGGVDARAHVHHDVRAQHARVARQAVHLHLRAGRACVLVLCKVRVD